MYRDIHIHGHIHLDTSKNFEFQPKHNRNKASIPLYMIQILGTVHQHNTPQEFKHDINR